MPIYFARKGNYLSKIYFREKSNATIVHKLEKYLYCLKKSFASECILWIMASAKYIFFQYSVYIFKFVDRTHSHHHGAYSCMSYIYVWLGIIIVWGIGKCVFEA